MNVANYRRVFEFSFGVVHLGFGLFNHSIDVKCGVVTSVTNTVAANPVCGLPNPSALHKKTGGIQLGIPPVYLV